MSDIINRSLEQLIIATYHRFKEKYPDDEPWWKVSCYRKHPKINNTRILSNSDLRQNWRSGITNEIPDLSIPKTIITKTQINNKEMKYTEVKEHNPRALVDKNHPANENRVYKTCVRTWKDVVVEKHTTTNYVIPNLERYQVEIRENEPTMVDVMTYNSATIHVGQNLVFDSDFKDDISIITKEIALNSEQVPAIMERAFTERRLIEDKVVRQSEDLVNQKRIQNDLKIRMEEEEKTHNSKIIELKMVIAKLQGECDDTSKKLSELERKSNEEEQKILEKLSRIIGKKPTVAEIIGKYSDIQEKLNMIKQEITPICLKYSKLKLNDLVKEKGFILSIPSIIRFFRDRYDDEEDNSLDADFDDDDADLVRRMNEMYRKDPNNFEKNFKDRKKDS